MEPKVTKDGLPVVSGNTYLDVASKYPIASPDNSSQVRELIKAENPFIARIIESGIQGASTPEARVYFECGAQIVYEMLRKESAAQRRI